MMFIPLLMWFHACPTMKLQGGPPTIREDFALRKAGIGSNGLGWKWTEQTVLTKLKKRSFENPKQEESHLKIMKLNHIQVPVIDYF